MSFLVILVLDDSILSYATYVENWFGVHKDVTECKIINLRSNGAATYLAMNPEILFDAHYTVILRDGGNNALLKPYTRPFMHVEELISGNPYA